MFETQKVLFPNKQWVKERPISCGAGWLTSININWHQFSRSHMKPCHIMHAACSWFLILLHFAKVQKSGQWWSTRSPGIVQPVVQFFKFFVTIVTSVDSPVNYWYASVPWTWLLAGDVNLWENWHRGSSRLPQQWKAGLASMFECGSRRWFAGTTSQPQLGLSSIFHKVTTNVQTPIDSLCS